MGVSKTALVTIRRAIFDTLFVKGILALDLVAHK
jgi:hypothetical protein